MPTFKLDRDTTVECVLFERFANFLAKLNYKRKPNIDEFREYVGQLLSGDNMPPLSAETVKGYFLDTKPHAEIEGERFRCFCNKFDQIFRALLPDDKTRYKDIYDAFVNWREGIYQKQGWDTNVDRHVKPVTAEKRAENLKEITEDDFLDAIRTLAAYYRQPNTAYLFEQKQLHVLMKHIEPRLHFEKQLLKNIDFLKFGKNRVINRKWALYELHNGKIAERKIEFSIVEGGFSSNPETHGFHVFMEYYESENNKLESYSCTFDLLHGSISINNRHTFNGMKHTIFYNLSFDDFHSSKCFGHKLSYKRESQTFTVQVVMMELLDQSNYNKEWYLEHDLHSDAVPHYVRAVLLCPAETRPSPHPFTNMHETIDEICNFITIT